MRPLFFIAFGIVILFPLLSRFSENKKPAPLPDLTAFKKQRIVRCTPDWKNLQNWLDETSIPPIPGAGKHQWKISTTSDSAQFYFNQGINMYYSFHIIEAMASFKKAAKFDPGSAMLYWAQALAYGPNINDYGYTATYNAYQAAGLAIESCGKCSEKEQLLIRAQRSRYTGDSAEDRTALNKIYTAQMKEVYEKFPDDADVAALYADAMMLQHPWDLWLTDGTPRPWTPEIRSVLEKLLAKYPDHPGGNHYYIHVMEPSPYAAKALPSANRLGKTNPGLSHVVHMPSHIYLRTGYYQKGVDVNIHAVSSYLKSIPLYAPVTGADFLYIIHNLHMKTNNAMLTGNFKTSDAAALETQKSIAPDYLSIPAPMGSYMQYIYMTPVLVYVRFGKWAELLRMPQPDASQIYGNILYHFGRGMALANQSGISEAKNELQQIQNLMQDSGLAIPFTPFSSAHTGAYVAENILKGTIALYEKRMPEAIMALEKASAIEENMVYNEPRDWLLNPKHYLGNAYLAYGDGVKAGETFKKDLLNNHENGWALMGLHQAFILQNKKTDAGKVMSSFKKAFALADVQITSPVY
jgi:tetratricopeptide (TPR) repeat protein